MKSPRVKTQKHATKTHNGVNYDHIISMTQNLKSSTKSLKHNELNHLRKPYDNSVDRSPKNSRKQ